MNLRTAVLDLGEQVEAVADGDRRLPGHEPHPHQSQTDPRQPILTRLTVGVEKRPNALEVITDFIINLIRKERPCKCFNILITQWRRLGLMEIKRNCNSSLIFSD